MLKIRRYEYGDTLLIEALPYKEHAFDGWQGWNMPYSKDKQIVLYCNFDIERVSASRMINSNAKKRGAINELLISNIASVF